MANLLTPHDRYRVHALCGLLALIHYVYRLRLLVLDVEDCGFGTNIRQDVVSLIAMVLPSLTSLLFTIVPTRKGLDGFTIWKEYRWHAFIFAAKFWIFLGLLVYAKHFHPHTGLPHENLCRVVFEFATMYAAKSVTDLHPKQVSTIRGMYSSTWSVLLAGFLQFMGRGAMLYGPPDARDRMSMCFMGVFVIQLNAFNMTLRKKRIIGPKTTQAYYSIMLVSAFYLLGFRRFWATPPSGAFDPRFKAYYVSLIAYICRRQGADRFSSWIVALSFMTVLQPLFDSTSGELTMPQEKDEWIVNYWHSRSVS